MRNFMGMTAAVGLAFLAGSAGAQDVAKPGPVTGTITVSATAVAAGVGYTWGDGVLDFHGHEYHFTVKGISVIDVGYAKVIGHGRVYGLHRLADFSGTYGAATGNATLGNGIGGQFLQNAKGVQIRIDQMSKGARLAGSADGIELTLKR